MKTEHGFKVEGDVLKINATAFHEVDTDQNGTPAAKIGIQLNAEFDGSEVALELVKSSSIAQKVKEQLVKMGLVKE